MKKSSIIEQELWSWWALTTIIQLAKRGKIRLNSEEARDISDNLIRMCHGFFFLSSLCLVSSCSSFPFPFFSFLTSFSRPSSFCSFPSLLYLCWSFLPLLQMLSAALSQQTCTKLALLPITMLRAGVSGWITSISCPAPPRDNLMGFAQPLPASPTSVSWNMFHSPALAFLIHNMGNWDFSQSYQNYPQKNLFFIDV